MTLKNDEDRSDKAETGGERGAAPLKNTKEDREARQELAYP